MPRPVSKLNELDAAAAGIQSLTANGTFKVGERVRLVARFDTHVSDSGLTIFEIDAGFLQGRERKPSEPWRRQGRKFSTVLKAFVNAFPMAASPPSQFVLSCRGTQVAPVLVQKLVLDAIAEAAGQPASPATAPPAQPRQEPVSWVPVLRSGADGLKRWNRLKAADRKSVDLTGADLGGLALSGANLRGVSAKRASFVGSRLSQAELTEGSFDGSDFSAANLEDARLKGVRAPEAIFRSAMLARAELRQGLFTGASFAGADLTGANLADANLHNADFTGAVLIDTQFEGATFDLRTAWPTGFAIPPEVIFAGRGTDPRLSGKGKNAVATDVSGLIARLRSTIDPKRMKRTMDMLKSGRNQLFAEVEPQYVRGIVRSQTEEELYYSCVLTADGVYACSMPNLTPCLGLCGEPCKHLLVLVIGLARAGLLEPAAIDPWIVAATGKNHRWNKTTQNHVSESLLRYKGVQAGEVDWRPTETIPEDFYTL